MNHVCLLLSGCVALLGLAGCAGVVDYVPAPGERTTTVHFIGYGGSPTMCFEKGTTYRLPLTKNGNDLIAQLPTGKRLTVRVDQKYEFGREIAICNAGVSFVPVAGQTGIVNVGMTTQGCRIEAVRADLRTPTGLTLDPTMGPPQC